MKTILSENWKDIPSFPGYKISDWGRVMSFKRDPNGRLRAPYLNPRNGYKYVLLRGADQKDHMLLLHRLVASAFCPNPDPMRKTYVNHLDENKDNNHFRNLEWTTCKENANWGYQGRIKQVLSREKYHAEHPGRYQRMVGCFDKNTGQLIKMYENVQEAAKDLRIKNYKSVNNACVKPGKLLRGMLWDYMSDGLQRVKAWDAVTGNFLKEYASMAEAARELGVKINGIFRCCHNQLKTAYKMKFEFVNPL